MPPSIPSMTSSGPTPSSFSSSVAGARLSGGMESTDQGPAKNTYSMQVYVHTQDPAKVAHGHTRQKYGFRT